MLLALDVGNTETVMGLFSDRADGQPEELLDHWRLATKPERTSDEMGLVISGMLHNGGFSVDALAGVAVCSTVPRVQTETRRVVEDWLRLPSVFVGPGVRTGISILYDDPREVGPDRIANAVGAFSKYHGATIVVDFGTATTLDVVTSKGEYLGGAILPGMEISLEALFQRASLLRRVEVMEPKRVIGRSTAESIQSGVIYGIAEQVDGLVRRMLEEVGPAMVLATGGLGRMVVSHCATVAEYDPWLTLFGLSSIYYQNQ